MPCEAPWESGAMHRLSAGPIMVLVLGVLTGCASGETGADEQPTPAATSRKSTSPAEKSSPPAEDVVEVSVSVRDGKVLPPPRRVEVQQGATVSITVTLDVDDVVHVHGSDIEEPVQAGRPATIELVAGDQGVFEVETHDGGLALLQLEVR